MKILVEYDPSTGMVNGPDGSFIGSVTPSSPYIEHNAADDKPKLSAINSLKESGFTAEEIIDMRKAGLI